MTASLRLPAPVGESERLRRLRVAMTAAGLAALAMLYATQASLPAVAHTFGVGATAASLTVSVATGLLAFTVLPVSSLAERAGRPRVMTAGLLLASLSLFAGSLAPTLWLLLVTRGVDGLALAGVVAVAMGHIGDEVEPAAASVAIGGYVAATSVGGLLGRLVPAGLDGAVGWRGSMAALAGVGAVCTAVFATTLPPSRHAATTDRPPARPLAPLRDPGVVRLCLVAFLLMGGFVATYNYLTFRLAAAPFGLPSALRGLVFVAYLAGTVSSTMAGRLAARHGRRRVALGAIALALGGLLLTLPGALPCVLLGLVVFTGGYFAAHAVASGWVGARVATGKSQASALYLMGYYLGSSLGGSLIGLAWSAGGWPATVAVVGACVVLAGVTVASVRAPGRPAG